jgi:hypothetical protein
MMVGMAKMPSNRVFKSGFNYNEKEEEEVKKKG